MVEVMHSAVIVTTTIITIIAAVMVASAFVTKVACAAVAAMGSFAITSTVIFVLVTPIFLELVAFRYDTTTPS
jgi:hypothetical protein